MQFLLVVEHMRSDEPSEHVDQTMVPWALNESRLRKHFRGEEAYPKMIKIRVYVIRAINVHLVKGMTVANPYLVFSVGKTKVRLSNPALLMLAYDRGIPWRSLFRGS